MESPPLFWSNSMDPTTSRDVFERTKQEHDALREQLRQIHEVLTGPEIMAEEMLQLLRELHNELTVHFASEEGDGFFQEVITVAPRLQNRAGQLCVEHEQMLYQVTELCRFAAAGSPSMPWWQELGSRCHEFSKQLMHHESEENKLLQQTLQEDIGPSD
jgi:iron-sulfur cluster repair protein YtfE (RIC family)